jgi:hypothetical protein
MSLAFLSKPIGGKKNVDPQDDSGTPQKAGRQQSPHPARGGASDVTVGGSPRVDLMPTEIRVKRSQLRFRRKLRFGLVGVFIVVVAACGGTWALSAVAQTNLAATQSESQQLVVQQQQYAAVTSVKDSIALIQAGEKVGASTEIDWQAYLAKLQATLPAGVALTGVQVDSATPLKGFAPATVPLQGDRIATLTFTATSASLPSIPTWLDGLETLPGFADAIPGQVALSSGVYTATVTMHINTEAFANRFAKTTDVDSTTDSTATTGGN